MKAFVEDCVLELNSDLSHPLRLLTQKVAYAVVYEIWRLCIAPAFCMVQTRLWTEGCMHPVQRLIDYRDTDVHPRFLFVGSLSVPKFDKMIFA